MYRVCAREQITLTSESLGIWSVTYSQVTVQRQGLLPSICILHSKLVCRNCFFRDHVQHWQRVKWQKSGAPTGTNFSPGNCAPHMATIIDSVRDHFFGNYKMQLQNCYGRLLLTNPNPNPTILPGKQHNLDIFANSMHQHFLYFLVYFSLSLFFFFCYLSFFLFSPSLCLSDTLSHSQK